MADKNINETETKNKIKARNIVGLSIGGACALTGVAAGVLMLTGLLGVTSFIFLIGSVAALSVGAVVGLINTKGAKASKNAQVVDKKSKDIKLQKKANKTQKRVVVKEVESDKKLSQIEVNKNIRSKYVEQKVKANTFAVYDEDGQLYRDMNGNNMIYRIGDKTEKDFRYIIPSLTANELAGQKSYDVVVCDKNADKTDFKISAISFDNDMKKVYNAIKQVRKDMFTSGVVSDELDMKL